MHDTHAIPLVSLVGNLTLLFGRPQARSDLWRSLLWIVEPQRMTIAISLAGVDRDDGTDRQRQLIISA
jgi:hypothetical protein